MGCAVFVFVAINVIVASSYPYSHLARVRGRRIPNPRQIYSDQNMLLRGARDRKAVPQLREGGIPFADPRAETPTHGRNYAPQHPESPDQQPAAHFGARSTSDGTLSYLGNQPLIKQTAENSSPLSPNRASLQSPDLTPPDDSSHRPPSVGESPVDQESSLNKQQAVNDLHKTDREDIVHPELKQTARLGPPSTESGQNENLNQQSTFYQPSEQQMPLQQSSNEQMPYQQRQFQLPSNQQRPYQQKLGQQMPFHQPSDLQRSYEQPPDQQMPFQQPSNQRLPFQQPSDQQIPLQHSSDQQLPFQQPANPQMPYQQTSNQQKPFQQPSDQQLSFQHHSSGQQIAFQQTANQQRSFQQSSDQQTPFQKQSNQQSPLQQQSAEQRQFQQPSDQSQFQQPSDQQSQFQQPSDQQIPFHRRDGMNGPHMSYPNHPSLMQPAYKQSAPFFSGGRAVPFQQPGFYNNAPLTPLNQRPFFHGLQPRSEDRPLFHGNGPLPDSPQLQGELQLPFRVNGQELSESHPPADSNNPEQSPQEQNPQEVPEAEDGSRQVTDRAARE